MAGWAGVAWLLPSSPPARRPATLLDDSICSAPTQVGQLNEELDRLAAIAGTWKNEDAAKRAVTEEQAAVLRGLMQARPNQRAGLSGLGTG